VSVKVVTDSACDLPEAVVAELGIEIVPLTIRFGSEELVDREELTNQAFWQRLATATTLTLALALVYIGALFGTAVIVWQVTGDEEATAFEGVALIAAFVILAIVAAYQ